MKVPSAAVVFMTAALDELGEIGAEGGIRERVLKVTAEFGIEAGYQTLLTEQMVWDQRAELAAVTRDVRKRIALGDEGWVRAAAEREARLAPPRKATKAPRPPKFCKAVAMRLHEQKVVALVGAPEPQALVDGVVPLQLGKRTTITSVTIKGEEIVGFGADGRELARKTLEAVDDQLRKLRRPEPAKKPAKKKSARSR